MNKFLFIFVVMFFEISIASNCKDLVSAEMKRGGLAGDVRLTHSDYFNSQTMPDALSSQQRQFAIIEKKFLKELLQVKIASINNDTTLSARDKKQKSSNLENFKTPEFWELEEQAKAKARGTEVGRMLYTATKKIKAKIAPFETVYMNASREGVSFDKVSVYGAEPNVVRVFTKNDRPVALQSFKNANGKRVEKISFIDETCKVNKFMEATHFSHGTSYDYYSSQACTQDALKQIQKLSSAAAKSERDPRHEGNEFGFRCEEQGASFESGCRCADGKFINPWVDSCFKERKPASITAKDKLEALMNEKESSVYEAPSDLHETVKSACEFYGEDIAGFQKSSTLMERLFGDESSPTKQ